jgi:glutamyl-tRNA reductase
MSPNPVSLPLHGVTLNHHTAPSALRERFAFGTDGLRATLREAKRTHGIERLVLLATCQRIEAYTASAALEDARERLTHWLADMGGVTPATIETHAVALDGWAAARHLCRVAAGLDSTLLGEAEILAQVAAAGRASVASHAASPVLKALVRAAVLAGERARGAVWSHFPRADIGSVAADVIAETVGPLHGAHAVVIGAGEVGRLAMRALRAHEVATLDLVNRTPERAAELCTRYGGMPHGLDALPDILAAADAVIVATGAMTPLLDAAGVSRVLQDRTDRPIVIIDAAMPRNVEPSVRDIPNVHLFDLDDLAPTLGRARDQRAGAIPGVEAIIEHELSGLATRYAQTLTLPSWQRIPAHAPSASMVPSPVGTTGACIALPANG